MGLFANNRQYLGPSGVHTMPGFEDDDVNHPSHYQIAEGVEVIDVIDAVMAHFEFLTPMEGYMLGNFLKYRLRAGDKDDLAKDINKSNVYRARLRESRAS